MIPLSFHRLIHALTVLPLLLSEASAEIFHLKDGRRIDGRITRETEDSYIVEVQAGRGIWEEMTLSRDQVLRIDRSDPAELAFNSLAEFIPTPDLLTAEEYLRRVQAARGFLAEHADSEHVTKVGEILETLETESKIIGGGGIKLGGKLIAADERLANQYEIDSRAAEVEIMRLAQSGNVLAALRAFTEFDNTFGGSDAWHESLPVIQQLISAQQSHARQMLDAIKGRLERQERGLSRMSVEERQSTLRAIAERDAGLKARHDQEKGIRNHWPSIHPDYAPALEDTIRIADQESKRLTAAANQAVRSPSLSELWRSAYSAIQTGDATQIRQAIQAARAAKMAETYLERLQTLADQAQIKAAGAKQLEAEAAKTDSENDSEADRTPGEPSS